MDCVYACLHCCWLGDTIVIIVCVAAWLTKWVCCNHYWFSYVCYRIVGELWWWNFAAGLFCTEFFPCFPMGRNDGALAGFRVNKPFLFYLLIRIIVSRSIFHNKFIFGRLNRWFDACVGLAPCICILQIESWGEIGNQLIIENAHVLLNMIVNVCVVAFMCCLVCKDVMLPIVSIKLFILYFLFLNTSTFVSE
jgi:hypothetical protein